MLQQSSYPIPSFMVITKTKGTSHPSPKVGTHNFFPSPAHLSTVRHHRHPSNLWPPLSSLDSPSTQNVDLSLRYTWLTRFEHLIASSPLKSRLLSQSRSNYHGQLGVPSLRWPPWFQPWIQSPVACRTPELDAAVHSSPSARYCTTPRTKALLRPWSDAAHHRREGNLKRGGEGQPWPSEWIDDVVVRSPHFDDELLVSCNTIT
jgi:hypothetical protein